MQYKKHLDFKRISELFIQFCQIVARLRDPNGGCPWDLKQDHKSLRKFMIEEAYEAAFAMGELNYAQICEELGDVLLQVVLNSHIAFENNQFSLIDVISAISEKMIRRHPHVFADNKDVDTPEKVLSQWEKIKNEEKTKCSHEDATDIFGSVKSFFPSTQQAYEIGKRANKINFDWTSPREVFEKFETEVQELKAELKNNNFEPNDYIKEEIGDVYFCLAQLCRHLGYEPELVALDGNIKFLERFKKLQQLAIQQGIDITKASLEQLENLWQQAKTKV